MYDQAKEYCVTYNIEDVKEKLSKVSFWDLLNKGDSNNLAGSNSENSEVNSCCKNINSNLNFNLNNKDQGKDHSQRRPLDEITNKENVNPGKAERNFPNDGKSFFYHNQSNVRQSQSQGQGQSQELYPNDIRYQKQDTLIHMNQYDYNNKQNTLKNNVVGIGNGSQNNFSYPNMQVNTNQNQFNYLGGLGSGYQFNQSMLVQMPMQNMPIYANNMYRFKQNQGQGQFQCQGNFNNNYNNYNYQSQQTQGQGFNHGFDGTKINPFPIQQKTQTCQNCKSILSLGK
jgi:hypothetical protein